MFGVSFAPRRRSRKSYRQFVRLLITAFACSVSFAPFAQGESLNVLETMTLSADKGIYIEGEHGKLHVIGVYLAGDTTFVITSAGLVIQFSRKQPWKKVLDCEPWGNNWWEDFEKAKKKNAMFSIECLWPMPGSNETVVFDNYMSAVYRVNFLDLDDVKVKFWKSPDEKSSVYTVSAYNNLVFYAISSGYHDTILAVSGPDMSDFHMVFECPLTLKGKLDSVWADPCCYPAWNPINSTIWLAFMYYDFIYIVNMNGQLLDTIQISATDFRLPQPPRSRMHSNAVFQDWISKCTPVESFWYAPPGYFLLQFRSGWRKIEADSIQLRSTLAWTVDRQPVELAVDEDWELVGVQPDGRVIFAHYVIEDNEFKEIVLHIARIEQ
jgi:hypothetical protein